MASHSATEAAGRPADPDTAAGQFRLRCRSFLEANARFDIPSDRDDPRGDAALAAARDFQGRLAAAGLAGITYPIEFGGQGLPQEFETTWREESARFPLQTGRLAISHGMCLPVLNEFGTIEQKSRYMARLISAEEVWCQLFSEPGAGSDVASLTTRAERDGDEWVLNGQKVWSTLAHLCERGIVLARSDWARPKHQGISMFIVDMRAPGVDVRPIRQVDGRSRFNEVFFTSVRVPADHMIPPENEGWRLATAMLMYERVAIGAGQQGGIITEWTDALIDLARRRGVANEPVIRDRLVRLYAAEVTQSLLAAQTRSRLNAGQAPGPGGSLGKLCRSGIARMVQSLAFDITGCGGVAWEAGDSDGDRWSKDALQLISASIAGGTDEVQHNIIGERVLGLPREPAADRDRPFADRPPDPTA
jgi:alkylation response protein AidB-like acyl-CoA dehydrogenase